MPRDFLIARHKRSFVIRIILRHFIVPCSRRRFRTISICKKRFSINWIALKWSRWQDLNLRPFGPEPNALPNCATPRKWSQWRDSNPWPAVYETAALPTEPHWHLSFATSRIRLTRQNYTRIAFACQPFFHTFFASFWKLCRSASKPGIPCFPPRTNMVY